ncbi:HEAT repeat domain-containing protein [Aquitalea sp. LB_tupeE]|uniref:HEAT repeat domain-containing protein n=1 Tax=Aquitalea sp. LB_tupeE TaxID=2748078 RepID=UPI0015C04F54|nr:HEAT repeat domain-containing protein [Aquitalea sp. LB_tupeE]NWK76516.1 HEAT repeat domain-containing protein [Aquitalea sp. LB_tupeE]
MALKKSVTPAIEDAAESLSFADLITRLSSVSVDERRQAALALGQFPEAVLPLCRILPAESDRAVRDAALGSLRRLGGVEVAQHLADFLRSDDPMLRNGVIEVLQEMPDATASLVETLLRDVDPDVRIFTVNILESLKHPGVEGWLISVVEQDMHCNVVATAIDLLGEVGSPHALASLESAANRFADDPFIRFAVDMAKARIRQE